MTTLPLTSELPVAVPVAESSSATAELSIDDIVPDPENPWGGDDGEDDQGFADSIRKHGLLQPPRVRWVEAIGKWVITAGERRWRKTRAAGHRTILCVIDRLPPDPIRVHAERIAENLHRRTCRPGRLAKALQALQEKAGYTLEQLAEAIGKKGQLSYVSRKLSLLKLPQTVLDAIDGSTAASDEATFVEISKIKDLEQREALAQRAVREPITREKATELVASLTRRPRACKTPGRPLRSITLRLPGGATVGVSCPDDMREVDTETALFSLEFAVRELKKAHRQGIAADRLRTHFEQLKPKEGSPSATVRADNVNAG